MKLILVFFSLFLWLGRETEGCGVGTHTEINNRAMAFYNNSIFGPGVIKRILHEQQPAFQVFLDTFVLQFNKVKILSIILLK